MICPDRLSTAAKNLLALLPEPSPNSTGFSSNYQISRPATFDQDQFDTRGDYFVTSKTVVFGKFSYFKANFNTPTAYGVAGGGAPLGGPGVANAGLSSDHDKSLMFDYQHTFSPSLLTEARFAFSRLVISELQPDYNTDAATALGIPNVNLGTVYTSGLPEINVSDPLTPFNMGDFGLPFFEREANFDVLRQLDQDRGPPRLQVGRGCRKVFRHPDRRQRTRNLHGQPIAHSAQRLRHHWAMHKSCGRDVLRIGLGRAGARSSPPVLAET